MLPKLFPTGIARMDTVYNEVAPPIRVCVIATSPVTFAYLYRGQFKYMVQRGIAMTAVCSPGTALNNLKDEPVCTVAIPMEREPSPVKDLIALVRLWWFLVNNRFDIVHVSTPKASLLGAIAARLSGHRRLIFTLRGRAYENETGLKRWIFETLDRLICQLATRVNPICRELGDQIVREKLCSSRKIRLIGNGSSNGIDLKQFTRTPEIERKARMLREQYGIAADDLVILSIGRIRKDKGINELVRAFEALVESKPNIHLLLVGRTEDASPVDEEILQVIRSHPRIHHLEWQHDPAAAYAASDIMAFPTHREGFGNVALEASAMEIPVVASDIMGCRESVANGVSGILVPMQDVAALRNALERLIDDPQLRCRLGQQGRQRVEMHFRQEIIWEGLIAQYVELMGNKSPI